MPGIFICYRREDSGPQAGRLYDRLSAHFGKENVFRDIDTIEPGLDFEKVIRDTVCSCDVLIAVIGKRWLVDTEGRRRLDHPGDFVRLELETALQRTIRIVPALVDDAIMPGPVDLPEAVAPLSGRQAFEISEARFGNDVDRLIEILEKDVVVGEKGHPRPTRSSGWREVCVLAFVITLAIGIGFRLWQEEARLSLEGYLVVFCICLGMIFLVRSIWTRFHQKE
jgi:TIR domain